MKRINVVGTSGSGKSTFSRKLAQSINAKYIELDSLVWKDNWTKSGDRQVSLELENKLQKQKWVLDGNYDRFNELKWKHADTIIWLDLSFTRTLFQVIKRSFSRVIFRKKIWLNSNNKETIFKSFFSKDSVILWACTSFYRNKKKYLDLFESDRYPNVKRIRLTSQNECKEFLESTQQF